MTIGISAVTLLVALACSFALGNGAELDESVSRAEWQVHTYGPCPDRHGKVYPILYKCYDSIGRMIVNPAKGVDAYGAKQRTDCAKGYFDYGFACSERRLCAKCS
jgi:hypothetical protein